MVVYLILLSQSKAMKLQVPQALWSGKQPNYDWLHIFSTMEYCFLDYGIDDNFGFRLWDLHHKKLIRRNNVVFNKELIKTYPDWQESWF